MVAFNSNELAETNDFSNFSISQENFSNKNSNETENDVLLKK